MAKGLKEETDPFAALNAAMHVKGAFVFVPPKVEVQAPIQYLNLMTPQNSPITPLFLPVCIYLPRITC